MKVKRNGKIYNVIDHIPQTGEVCVEDTFEYAEEPHQRQLKMWWSLADCEIVDEQNPQNKVK